MDAADLNGAVDRLTAEFGEVCNRDAIETLVVSSLDQLTTGATTNAFVPLLAERFARQRLQALVKIDGTSPTGGLPAVLFLCVHNAGRSQMALGWFRHFARGRAIAWSGGSEPGAQINPSAVAVMAEVGIDITGEFPKPWTDEIVRAADVVVTMGCGDACPFYPGKRYEDWEVEDPAGQEAEAVRPIRDDIRDRVVELLQSLSLTVG
jgi:arsenate reductase